MLYFWKKKLPSALMLSAASSRVVRPLYIWKSPVLGESNVSELSDRMGVVNAEQIQELRFNSRVLPM